MATANVLFAKDAVLMFEFPDTNFGDSTQPNKCGWTDKNNQLNLLMKADMTLYVPAGSTVNSATLKLYVDSIYGTTPIGPFRGYRVRSATRAWEEYDTSLNLPGCTWNRYITTGYGEGSAWGTAGGSNTTSDIYGSDFFTTASLSATGWFSTSITSWTQTAWSTYSGIVDFNMITQQLTPDAGYAAYFSAYNRNDATYPPYIEVDYTAAAGAPTKTQVMIF